MRADLFDVGHSGFVVHLAGAVCRYFDTWHERAKNGSELIVDSWVGPVLADGVDKKGFLEDDRERQT